MVTNGLNVGTAVKHHLNEIVRSIRNFVVTLHSRLNRHGHNNSTNIYEMNLLVIPCLILDIIDFKQLLYFKISSISILNYIVFNVQEK